MTSNTTQEITMNESPGFTHVAVPVSDLARSTAWYADPFDSAPVLDEDVEAGAFHHTVFAIGGGHLFGLHAHAEPRSAPFDERGIVHGDLVDAPDGSGLSFRDPDGIALELLAPPA